MRLLLDTHTLLWWLDGATSLSSATVAAIGSPRSDVYVSSASAWEMSVKQARGRLDAPTDLREAIDAVGFRELPTTIEHAGLAGALPMHHADPFDRVLIAQAKLEDLTIVTRDQTFAAYGVPVMVA